MMDLHILLDPVSDFWKCLKRFFRPFFNHIFDMFGLIRSIKTFSKVQGVSMNIGPYMAYNLYIYTKKKVVLGVQNVVFMHL